MPAISILGAGRMGSAIARALLAAGHDVAVWNRTAAALEPLRTLGVRVCATVIDAVTRADTVVVSVLDYAASDAILTAPEVVLALRGTTLVELTSGTPADARARGAWAAEHGIPYVDGVVLVTPDLVGTPRATVLASGPAPLVDACEWLALGGQRIHVGEGYGQAAALDVALIATLWGAMFSVIWGARICRAEAVPLERYAALLGALQPITSRAMSDLLDHIARDAYAADAATRASLAVHRVGVEHMRATRRDLGISTELPDAFAGPLARAAAAGHDDAVLAVLVRHL